MLGGGEAGRAWWRALCLNSSRLDSAVETVPTTTVPDTMAPDTMAPETMAPKTMAPETLVPEEIGRAIEPEGLGLDDQHGLGTCAEAETSVSVGRGWEDAERVATRNAG